MTKRIIWVDALKAFAILLVMTGHTLHFTIDKTYQYIGVLQMPLFMAISGYCSYKANVKWNVVKKRFLQLVIPFLCWPLVWYMLKIDFTDIKNYYLHLMFFPDTGLWFLNTLFYITLVDFYRNKITKTIENHFPYKKCINYYLSLLITEILLLILYWLYKHYEQPGNWLNFVALYYPYYSLGCIMRHNNELLLRNIQWWGSLGFIIYITGTPFFYGYLWQIILATGGIFGVFSFFYKLCDCPLPSIIKFIGMNTLGIYAVHQPIIHNVKHFVVTDPLWADVLMTFIITLTISITVVWLFNKNKILAFLFLGKPLNQNKR